MAFTFFFSISPAAFATVASGVGIVQSGLVFDFDAANPSGGTGSTMSNLVTSNSGVTGSMQAGVSRSTANGNTFLFDGGTTSYATVNIGSTDFSSGFSLTFYAKFSSPSAYDRTFERIIDFASAAATTGDANYSMWVGRYVDTNDLSVEVWNGTSRPGNCRAVGAIQPGVFAHYAVTINGSTCTFYLNKNAQTTTYFGGGGYINPPAVTRSSAFIGKSNWNDDLFKGEIGEIALYNSVLSQSDVDTNYGAQTDITAPSFSDTYLTSPENQLSISTLSTSGGTTFSTRSGLDLGKLSLSSSGVFAFTTNPNFEAKDSYNSNYQYGINVRAMDPNGNYVDFYLQVTLTDLLESATLTAPSMSATPYKGISVTVTVTPAGDGTSIPGKVSYFMAGKRIAGCYKKAYVGTGNSTCSWKPTVQGNREISVIFTPTNNNFTAATSKKSVFVYRRTTLR